MATPGNVNRAQLESFYQNPGQVYDDLMTEGALGVLADQIDANAIVFGPNGAGSVPSSLIPGVSGTNVHAQLVSLENKIQQIQAGVIPSGSITTEMLQDLAVIYAKLSPDLKSTIDAAKLWRVNSGVPEYYNGTEWVGVGGGIMVASPNSREGRAEEVTVSNVGANHSNRLIYKFLPKFTGEVNISAELLDNAASNSAYLRAVSVTETLSTGAADASMAQNTLTNFMTPIDTIMTGNIFQNPIENATGKYSSKLIGQSVNASYAPVNLVLSITSGIPIYIFLSTGVTTAGRIAYVRNLSLNYDIVR